MVDIREKLGRSVKPGGNSSTSSSSPERRSFLDKINSLKRKMAKGGENESSSRERTSDSVSTSINSQRNLANSERKVSGSSSNQSFSTLGEMLVEGRGKRPTSSSGNVVKSKLENTLNYTLNELLALLHEEGGSDLHLTTGIPPVIRKHGKLVQTKLPPLNKIQVEYLLKNILKSEQQKKLEEKMTLDFSYTLQGVARFRVNIFYQREGLAGVFRIIPNKIPDLKSLNLPPVISNLTRVHRGLILVTGPTGSGKSTTLASMLDVINRERSEHIITIEDPIEFVHQHKRCIINQREIGESATTFSDALRSALREDPDIILVGEMRDLETISMAITAAETGHLVFATLHTSSAPKTIDRIIDAYPPHQQEQIRVMIAESLQAVISQTLIPTIDGQGRVCACEILINNPAVSNLIREGKTFQIYSVMQTSRQEGMQTLDQALVSFVKYRKISFQEAYRRAQDKKSFRDTCGRFANLNRQGF